MSSAPQAASGMAAPSIRSRRVRDIVIPYS
jgi:hypothetical protein